MIITMVIQQIQEVIQEIQEVIQEIQEVIVEIQTETEVNLAAAPANTAAAGRTKNNSMHVKKRPEVLRFRFLFVPPLCVVSTNWVI